MKKDFHIPIYDAMVSVVVTKEFQEEVLEAGYKEDVPETGAITLHYPDSPMNYIVVFHRETTSHGHIAHEAFHLAGKIMQDIGFQYTREYDEPWAYLIGFIVDGLEKIIQDDKDNPD